METPSGNTNMVCDFEIPEALARSGRAMRHSGFLCGTYAGVTYNSKAITDCTDGTVHLSCQINSSGD